MKLPRWTVWPAMFVLAAFLVPALPFKRSSSKDGASASAKPPLHKRVVVLKNELNTRPSFFYFFG